MRGATLLAVLAVGTMLAGCTSPAAPLPTSGTAPESARTAPSAFKLEGSHCVMGGGHSIHDSSVAPYIIPAPWKVADILDDVGPQLTYPEEPTAGIPSKGHTWGNWHVTFKCDAWTYDGAPAADLVFGFVVTKVEQPPFDEGPAGPRYIVNVLATSSDAMHEQLMGYGFHATLTKGIVEWPAPDIFHHILDTADHGVYESLFHTVNAGAMPQEPIRFWWQMENDDGTFTPIALDFQAAGGEHLLADQNGWFSHMRTNDHPPLPGAAGNIAGLIYQGFDFTLTLGPRADLKLDKAYVHL